MGDTALAGAQNLATITELTSARPLRAWQQAALEQYEEGSPKDFLVTATPGAGSPTRDRYVLPRPRLRWRKPRAGRYTVAGCPSCSWRSLSQVRVRVPVGSAFN